MRQKAGPQKPAAEHVINDIRRATRKHHSAEDKIRIVLEGLRGEESIAALCRREGIAGSRQSPYAFRSRKSKLDRSGAVFAQNDLGTEIGTETRPQNGGSKHRNPDI
jgi:hypothetical protein